MRMMRAACAALVACACVTAAAADHHMLYGYKLGQPLALAKARLGKPFREVPFDDGWKAWVFKGDGHFVIFETNPSWPDVIASIQIEGTRNPKGLGLDRIDLGSDTRAAIARLGPPSERTSARDGVSKGDVARTVLLAFGDGLSIEERDGKVASIKVLASRPAKPATGPDVHAFLRALKARDLYRVAEWLSPDLEVDGHKVVNGPMLGELTGDTALRRFLFGKSGLADLKPEDITDRHLHVELKDERGTGVVAGDEVVIGGRELLFVYSSEGWVLFRGG